MSENRLNEREELTHRTHKGNYLVVWFCKIIQRRDVIDLFYWCNLILTIFNQNLFPWWKTSDDCELFIALKLKFLSVMFNTLLNPAPSIFFYISLTLFFTCRRIKSVRTAWHFLNRPSSFSVWWFVLFAPTWIIFSLHLYLLKSYISPKS